MNKTDEKLDIAALLREHDLYANPLTEKQRAILEAAEELFGEHGYGDTPTAAIAKKAGVTEKTLFKHFPTKADLFRRVLFPALLRTMLPVQIRQVYKVLHESYASYPDLFAALAVDRWKTVRQFGRRARFALVELLQNDKFREDFGRLFAEHVFAEVVATMKTLQAEGKVRADVDPVLLARVQLFVIASFAVFRGVLGKDDGSDPEALAKTLADVIYNGMRPRA